MSYKAWAGQPTQLYFSDTWLDSQSFHSCRTHCGFLQLPLIPTQLWGPSSQKLMPTLAEAESCAPLGEIADCSEESTSWACSMS